MTVHLNAQPHPSSKEAEAHLEVAASAVWVAQTALGPPVKDVKQSTFTTGHLYWMYFHNTANIHHLIFKMTFKGGSPLTDQVQTFAFPGGYAGSVTTPFGVPLWAPPAKFTRTRMISRLSRNIGIARLRDSI
jgi:hypothetical protein